jgi:hypothetical protein
MTDSRDDSVWTSELTLPAQRLPASGSAGGRRWHPEGPFQSQTCKTETHVPSWQPVAHRRERARGGQRTHVSCSPVVAAMVDVAAAASHT